MMISLDQATLTLAAPPTPPPPSGIDLMDMVLSSGLLATVLGLLAKWLHDRKKAPIEREAALSTASQQNVDSALAIAAEARETAKATRLQLTEDAKCERARHDREMTSMRRRLARLEQRNNELDELITGLRREDEVKTTELAKQATRITRLEKNLGAARSTVLNLLEHIKEHTTGTAEIPLVDFSIFETKEHT